MVSDNGSVLDDVVRRLRVAVAPERVILFGSHARGASGPNSDLDLLLVVDTKDRLRCLVDANHALWGVEAAVDLVVYTPEEFDRFKEAPASFLAVEVLGPGVALHPMA